MAYALITAKLPNYLLLLSFFAFIIRNLWKIMKILLKVKSRWSVLDWTPKNLSAKPVAVKGIYNWRLSSTMIFSKLLDLCLVCSRLLFKYFGVLLKYRCCWSCPLNNPAMLLNVTAPDLLFAMQRLIHLMHLVHTWCKFYEQICQSWDISGGYIVWHLILLTIWAVIREGCKKKGPFS